MLQVISYNNILYPTFGDNMALCVTCNETFLKNSAANSCSLKCKIIQFSEKNENGCWIWKGTKAGDYGKLRWKLKNISAHKASYLSFKGNIPEGKWVCHTCDIPLCVNPDHLFIGSPKDNMRDCINKGRSLMGEKNHLSKFSDIQVNEMRLLKKEGFTYDRLSRIFNCSTPYLVNIIKEKIRR